VLGAITIGHHARVGSGSVVIKSAPPHSTIVGIPGRIIEEKGEAGAPGHELDHHRLPDLTAKAIAALHEQVLELAREVAALRHRPVAAVPPPSGMTPAEVEDTFRALDRSAKDAWEQAQPQSDGAGI
jgi:serine O-acetyltransferase